MADVEIGTGKTARRAFDFDDVSIVPSRRTRDPEDVAVRWDLEGFEFTVPLLSMPVDSVTDPATALEFARLGGLPVLDLEGLWTRHADPAPALAEIATLTGSAAVERTRQLYEAPIDPDLIVERIRAFKDAGVVAAGSLKPARVQEFAKHIAKADPDLFVISGTVVSAEHVAKRPGVEPLNLKTFVREFEVPVLVGGCASYQAALHLMRSGAVGVIVGVDAHGVGVPMATAVADAAGARMRHLVETGVYVQVIAAGGIRTGADVAKAMACGADAAMVDATGADAVGAVVGSLRRAMAMTGHETIKELQKAELVVRAADS